MVRATRLLVFLGRFAPAGLYAERLLKKPEQLGDFDRIAVFSARALSLIERGEDQQASYFIEKGRDIIDAKQLDAAGRVPRDLAQLYYALGEYRRVRAERVVFQPMPPNFGAVLEERCQLLLDAQSAYSDSMRAYDAHWSAMAGFRIAELYQKLHQDLLAVQPPPSADTERKRQLFEGAVRTRYAILLAKAKGMAEHTLAMAERTGEQSPWVDRTHAALKDIDQSIRDEENALAKLPYTKQDFEAYFAQMDQAAAPKSIRPAATPRP
jgi:tetratricopeptide (TPR) repeat protein